MGKRKGSFLSRLSPRNLPIHWLGGLVCLLLVLPIQLSVAAQYGEDDQEGSGATTLASGGGFPSRYPVTTIPPPTSNTTPIERPETPSVSSTTASMASSPVTELETTAAEATTSEVIPVSECRIPAYSLYRNGSANVIALNSSFVMEGKCYATCIMKGRLELGQQHLMLNSQYVVWPYYRIVAGVDCIPHTYLHECTRSCYHWNLHEYTDTFDCSSACVDDCNKECGQDGYDITCNNPDIDEQWVNNTCPLQCQYGHCSRGCGLDLDCPSSKCQEIPRSPVSPPILTPAEGSTRAGLYSIDISSSLPASQSSQEYNNVVFLFEIFDVMSGLYNYSWVVDPLRRLDLANFACRTVSVRFAVLNKIGISEFSNSTRVKVYGDPTRRPYSVSNIQISEREDSRLGFLGHVILSVTWDGPQSELHLEGYTVEVFTTEPRCGSTWTRLLSLNESTNVTIVSESSSDLPITGCAYNVKVHAVGLDENATLLKSITTRIFPAGADFITDLECHKIWDSENFKFSFNFTWSLPFSIAFEDVIREFVVKLDLYTRQNPGEGLPDETLALGGPVSNEAYHPDNLEANETNFFYYLPHNGLRFFQPQRDVDKSFKFTLSFHWNTTKIRFLPPANELYSCYTDALSPPPSTVRNFSVLSYQIQTTSKMAINFTWVPPSVANGVISSYNICLSRDPLNEQEEPAVDVFRDCDAIVEDGEHEASVVLHFIQADDISHLYLQMRAYNSFVPGDWNQPTNVSINAPDVTTGSTTTLSPISIPTVDVGGLVPRPDPSSDNVLTIGVPVIASIIVLLLCAIVTVVVWCCVRIQKRRKQFWRVTENPCTDPMYNVGPRNLIFRVPTDPQLPTVDEWEIPPSEVIMEDPLGEGAFGEVYKGVVKGPLTCSRLKPTLRNAICVPVAIKLLKESARGNERQDFLSEIDTMKAISEGHNPNVIAMVGCVTLQEPLSLITEFVPYGDLLSFLRTNRKLNAGHISDQENPYVQLGVLKPLDLVNFAYQIASGMEYLSSLGVVHRDLACRNVLVDEGKVLKITDFGMSREVDEIYVQQSKGRVPLKWMALESILAREFTSASDVWSYGITLWEIGTLGGFPYPSICNEDLVSLLKNGYRMEKPDNCSPEVYDIMLSCWNEDPGKRLMFTELRAKFDQMLQTNTEYIYFLPVNNGQAYYKIENAPEGMSLQKSPVLLHVTPASNQTSSSSPGAGYMPLSSLLTDKCPNHMSSHTSLRGQRSPRSLSPSQEHSNRRPSSPAASEQASRHYQRPASVVLANKRQKGNLYVDDPSKLAPGGNGGEKARPASMLASWKQMEQNDSDDVCFSLVTDPTFLDSEQRSNNRAQPRPRSISCSEQKTGNRDPRYVNDPGQYTVLPSSVPNGNTYLTETTDEAVFEMRDVRVESSSSSPESSTATSGTPDIQITVFQDYP